MLRDSFAFLLPPRSFLMFCHTFNYFQINFSIIQGIGRVPIVKRLADMNPIQAS